jgi:hypothetical protein
MTEPRYRIFSATLPHGDGPSRPTPFKPPPDLEPDLPVIERDPMLDAVVRVLDSQPEPGESVQRDFDRKERELRSLFDRLDHDDRAALFLRLTTGVDDPLITQLARLSTERRQRLLASLAEAPRRRVR